MRDLKSDMVLLHFKNNSFPLESVHGVAHVSVCVWT